VKKRQNPSKTLVAATYSKAKTYVFARFTIRDRGSEVRILSPRPVLETTAASAAVFDSETNSSTRDAR